MPQARFALALSRLEAAAARLEAIAVVPASPGAPDRVEFAALTERHAALRVSTTDALARLDRLIGNGEG